MDSRFRRRRAFRTLFRGVLAIAGSSLLLSEYSNAQNCEPVRSYRLQPETVYEQVPVTSMRIEYEDRLVEKEIVSYRPAVQERVEKRQYTVRKPVIETSTRNESYTVYKQVVKTDYVDETTYVNETSQVEQIITTMKPVVETQYQTQHVIVQKPITETVYQTQNYLVERPVTETTMQQQQHLVQRPVTETVMQTQSFSVQKPVTETTFQTQNYVAYQPVTTFQPATVDAGGLVAQPFVIPGDVQYRLRWQPAGYNVNTVTGAQNYRRGGLGWTPYQAPGQAFVQTYHQPNFQQVAVPQTSFMPQTFAQQVPIQTTRMQTEVVQQQVPITSTRMESQMVTQQVPVTTTRMQTETIQKQVPITTTRMENQVVEKQVPIQTQRMEAVQEKVMVPQTVQKPVTRKVARERIEYVPETHVRPVQTQFTTYKPEVVSDDVVIKTPYMERIVQKIQVPERIARSVPYTEMRTVARTYTVRVPLDNIDPIYNGSVSNWPIMDGPVVTAGAIESKGASGSSTQGAALGNPAAPNSDSAGITSKKPALTEEALLPPMKNAESDNGGLSIGPANGEVQSNKTTASKPPSTGKIRLQQED